MHFPYGASKGSSGGVIINPRGQAVAMHLESENNILTMEEPETESKQSHGSGKDAHSISADSAANSHGSISKSLILSHFPALMYEIS